MTVCCYTIRQPHTTCAAYGQEPPRQARQPSLTSYTHSNHPPAPDAARTIIGATHNPPRPVILPLSAASAVPSRAARPPTLDPAWTGLSALLTGNATLFRYRGIDSAPSSRKQHFADRNGKRLGQP